MARPTSDEEVQLKRRARRRLIGAIVLVAAIVVALPMVLDTEPRPISGDVSIKIPSPDSGNFSSRVVPVAPPGETPSAPAAKLSTELKPPAKAAAVPGDKPAAPPAEAAGKKPDSPPPSAKAVKPADTPAAAKADKIETAAKTNQPADRPAEKAADAQFVVQVIALADAEKAKQIQVQIAAGGIKSYTEVVKTTKGDVTRVRAGPFATRGAAESAREQLKGIGLAGNVVPK
jgi:DedD protein